MSFFSTSCQAYEVCSLYKKRFINKCYYCYCCYCITCTTLRLASCSLRALSSSLLAMTASSVFFFRSLFTFSSVSGELLFLCEGVQGGVREGSQWGERVSAGKQLPASTLYLTIFTHCEGGHGVQKLWKAAIFVTEKQKSICYPFACHHSHSRTSKLQLG